MQVDPIKPKLKPPGTKRLKLNCDVLLSTSAFKFKLRRYTMAMARTVDAALARRGFSGLVCCVDVADHSITRRMWAVRSDTNCSPRQPQNSMTMCVKPL